MTVVNRLCEKKGELVGVFLMPSSTREQIDRMKMRGSTSNEKILHFIAYMAELGYDLAIASAHNVSESPGFEICLLSFGNE